MKENIISKFLFISSFSVLRISFQGHRGKRETGSKEKKNARNPTSR